MLPGLAIATLTLRLRKPFKKTLPEEIARIRAAHPDAEFELWAEDEHRIGLKPILRKVWAKKGARPIITVQHRYKWTYLYAFVCVQSGQSFWLLAPSVNIVTYNRLLAEFAKAQGLGPTKQIAIVLDRAGWHRSAKVKIPDGLHFIFLPPSSPELQPAERLWQLSDQALANRHFADLEELEHAQAERCRWLHQQHQLIQAHTLFHWWPRNHILTM